MFAKEEVAFLNYNSYSLIGHLKKKVTLFFCLLVLGSASFEACLSSSKLGPVHANPDIFVF